MHTKGDDIQINIKFLNLILLKKCIMYFVRCLIILDQVSVFRKGISLGEIYKKKGAWLFFWGERVKM